MQIKTIVGLALALAGCAANNQFSSEPRSVAIEADAQPAAAVLRPNMQNLLARTSPSYLTLTVNEAQKNTTTRGDDILPRAVTSGSGFVISRTGYVITAGHVAIKAGNTVEARSSDGRLYTGKVIAVQRFPDTALVRLRNFKGMPVSPARTPCLADDSPVFSLGKPHAQSDTARIGNVKAQHFGRPVTYNGFGYPDAIVLSMNTRKGESGGPLFNQGGQLSGMMVSTLSDGRGHSLNLAHALPVSYLAKFACSKISCAPAWKRLAAANFKSCPN